SQPAADLSKHGDRFVRRESALFLQEQLQVAALDELRGKKLGAFELTEVEYADDVFVSHFPCENQFLLKAIQLVGFRGQFAANHLQSNQAVHFEVLRFVNRSHPTLTEHLEDFVPPRND